MKFINFLSISTYLCLFIFNNSLFQNKKRTLDNDSVKNALSPKNYSAKSNLTISKTKKKVKQDLDVYDETQTVGSSENPISHEPTETHEIQGTQEGSNDQEIQGSTENKGLQSSENLEIKTGSENQPVEIYDERNDNKIESNPSDSKFSPVEVYNVDVTSLVEFPIDYDRSFSYYYPYFYKTHLISFADEIDVSILSTNCLDYHCSYCDTVYTEHCFKCSTGFFLNGQTCSLSCPIGYTTDTLRGRCVENSRVVSSETVFTKSYTIGSCSNMCGKALKDCSCADSCKQNGNCCTDYENSNCDKILKTDSTKCANLTNNTCQFCDESSYNNTNFTVCLQCNSNFFFNNGNCLQKCPDNHITLENNLCKKNSSCNVQYCSECEASKPNQCKSCVKGKFLYQGNCVESCPTNYRADRISWNCVEAPVFAWYWVYPSRTSCKTHCGVVVQEDWDCSCLDTCFYYGNCCQDIEEYCPSYLFWRKANKKKTGLKKGNLKQENIKIVKKAQVNKKVLKSSN